MISHKYNRKNGQVWERYLYLFSITQRTGVLEALRRLSLFPSDLSSLSIQHPSSDMNMNSTSDTMTTMMMTPWLHFGGTDRLIFKTWQPMSNGAIAGACIALVAFCILDRWIAALRRQRELYWTSRTRTLILKNQGDQRSNDTAQKEIQSGEIEEAIPSLESTSNTVTNRLRGAPPFIPMQDIPRGIFHGVQVLFSYVEMLCIMTFNAAYVISIILGLAIGEVLFGRIGRA